MLFLLLAIVSSALISVFMRLSSRRVASDLTMLAANYLVCSLLGAVYAGPVSIHTPGYGNTLVMGLVGGVLYLVSFMALQRSTQRNGIVLSSIFMKLGLLVPMLLSVVVFRELPTAVQLAGFCLAVAAIVVINWKKGSTGKFHADLLLLLLLGGSADGMSKVYERLGEAALSDLFLFFIFSVALMLCVLLILIKKERPQPTALLFGVLIGIPNFFSSKFLLRALSDVPAVVVFPSFCVATMLLVTLSGVVLFKERLSKRQWIALAVILIALVLLNI